jgi:hypothetical protein
MKFKHRRTIQKGKRGTLAKCREELDELEDAHEQGNRWHSVIEAADLVNSAYSFVWREYRVPFFIVIAIALLTGIYKPISRFIRRL